MFAQRTVSPVRLLRFAPPWSDLPRSRQQALPIGEIPAEEPDRRRRARVLHTVRPRAQRIAHRPGPAARAGVGEVADPCAASSRSSPGHRLSHPRSSSAPPSDSITADRTDSARGSPTIGGSGWAMPGSASSTWPPAISRSPARTRACGSSSTASSTTSSARSATSRGRATASAPAPTARSPCTSTRTSARPACTSCAASSPSCSGTAPTTRSSPRAIASASSRSTTRMHGDTLYLASEIKALLAAGVPARWDARVVLPGHPLLAIHQNRTLFDGIYQVPPGHFLLATGGQVRLIRYWDFDYPTADVHARPLARRRVRRAVPARPGRGGPPAPPGRRAGRLLSQRRDRLVRRAGPGGAAPSAIRSGPSR